MLQSKAYVKKTRHGRVLKVVREHYLRDDIACGTITCTACDNSKACLSASPAPIIVFDTNVVLRQIDLLENSAISNVVVLSVVLEEVKNKDLSVYNRLRTICSNPARNFFVFSNENHRDTYIKGLAGESPNDRNDRAIRVASKWYHEHLGPASKVVLVTNDAENKRKALEEGIDAQTVEDFVRKLGQAELLDLLVGAGTEDAQTTADADDNRPSKRKVIYPEHKLMSEITSGLHKGIYHQGKLRVNRYNGFEATVSTESLGQEILIHGRIDMNRGFDGDVVAVELLPQEQWQENSLEKIVEDVDEDESEEPVGLVPGSAEQLPELIETGPAARPRGRVIGIIKRNWRQYCGSLEPVENTSSAGGKVILFENDINNKPFSQQVLDCLPPLPWSLPAEELQNPNRRDLRQVRVFSVDPPGCKDIDDALHCTLRPDGNYEVGVHIADVTNFVLPDTALDHEACQRDICSLRADVERLSFSVIWEMTPEAEIISAQFTKSIIKSCAAMSYAEAQARMDDSRLSDPLTVDLRNMNRLAKIMRQRRIDRGALTLASPEVKFEIDSETHDPLDVGMYQIREANQMIEEFMLAANVSVAEKIVEHFSQFSMLRRHPVPSPKMLEPLLLTAAAVGVDLDISTSKALADSLDRAVGGDPYFNKLIRILATRCMTQALYFSSGDCTPPEFHHYGLASPIYTHFTSPIRRYADVIVHRLLAAALGLSKVPGALREKTMLTSVADNLNLRHRNAQMASRASVELHTLIFFKNRPTDTEARIVRIKSNGLIVFVPKFGIEGPVYLTGKKDKKDESDWIVNEQSQTTESRDGKYRFKVLDKLVVHIEVVEPQPNRPKLQLTLVDQANECMSIK
ncbi:hypothetical protein AXG93_1783s1030 [Marchantia polymorpha subsp. ruderalis]|uniref:Uncharacterized protein n=1 Tax=Marchantia polymorpha subsp. ruderalis TaxID=1480154 RepID=A0A176VBZ3_MARPO|nr:hypothetical protein AXG93_1783s1030 [Marchantia polymorpha subsp. ruderalis]